MINYYLLLKPGIIFGNLVTLAAGFVLGSRGSFDFLIFLMTFLGLGLVIASACVFNNTIDREIDKKMERTRNRALALGTIKPPAAIFYALFLGLTGSLLLFFYSNMLTVALALFGFFIYVVIYSLWKRKTVYGTAIGSIAGAIPPVVGYTAASNVLDLGALLLFAILVLWQMPHFFSIAIYRFKDYQAAALPVLPVKKGMLRTKIHMVAYIAVFIAISGFLTYAGYTGLFYLIVSALLGVTWLILALKGFGCANDAKWARKMFAFSLVVVMGLSFSIPFSAIKPHPKTTEIGAIP